MRPRAISIRQTWLAVLVAACGPAVTADDETSGATSAPTTVDGSETAATTRSSSSTAETTSAPPDASSGADASDDGDGSGFIPAPDGGLENHECDIWIDDCPPGFKCMPWANDGGGSWNATKCSPLAEDPNGVGDPCAVVQSGVGGIDDCEAHAMCWNVDPETNEGTCVALCTGGEANPTCADPCVSCFVSASGVVNLCLPICDPLAQDCVPGEACYPVNDTFSCAPDAGGDAGVLGDPCEYLNWCDPGLFCANADTLPNCAGPAGCCTRLCDASAADPCAGIAGTECVPYFEENQQPPCYGGVVGGCLLPE